MADDTFEIALQVSGEDKAARAFENLKLREMEAKQEATKLAAELRKLQASGQASAEQIEATSRSLIRAKQQAQEYAAQARRVQQAIRQQSNATRDNEAANKLNAIAMTAVAQRSAAIVQALGQVGTIVTQANPELESLGRALGQVGSAAGAGAAAFGPWGAIIGGAIGTVQAFVSHLQTQEEAHRKAAEAARVQATDIERLMAAMGRENEIQRLELGLGSVAEQTSALESAQARLDAEHERVRRTREKLADATQRYRNAESLLSGAIIGSTDATRRLEQQQRHWQERIRSLRADLEGFNASLETQQRNTIALARGLQEAQNRATAEAEEEERRRRQEERRRNARQAAEARRREAERTAREIAAVERQLGEDEVAIFREAREEMQRLELDHYATQLDAMRAYLDERRRMQRAETVWYRQELASRAELDREIDREIAEESRAMDQEQREADAKKAEERTRLAQREKELAAITTNMWDSVGGAVTDAAGQMFRFVIEGAEGGSDAFLAMLDSFLEATSVEYTIKALAEVANAVAAAARQDYPAAAQHGIAAGLAAGVAAATGLASAAISVPTSATSGGSSTPVSPAGPPGGNTNVTIQLYAPQAVFTEAERAELLARGFREAERVRPGSARI